MALGETGWVKVIYYDMYKGIGFSKEKLPMVCRAIMNQVEVDLGKFI